MNKFVLMAFLCLYLTEISAQKPLSLGDTVPPLTLKNILNAPVSEISISEKPGQLVILDFWATWCAACISQFPHLQKLQDQFGDQVQIILVNAKSKISGDTPEKIAKTLDRTNKRTGIAITMPVAFDNPVVDELFPYRVIPHEVWIKDNIVVAVTSSLEVNAANIQAVLQGQPFDMRTKIDRLPAAGSVALMKAEGGPALFQSILTGYQEGYSGAGAYPDSSKRNQVTGLYYYNVSLENLLRDAAVHTNLLAHPSNRIVLELADPAAFNRHTDTSVYRYLYCYELRLPPSSYPAARAWMLQDLCRAFRIHLKQATRNLPCLVVSSKKSLVAFSNTAAEPTLDIEPDSRQKYLRNFPVKDALALLDRFCSIPIINETNLDGLLDLDLPYDMSSPDQLMKTLTRAGFEVRCEERPLEITLIADSIDF